MTDRDLQKMNRKELLELLIALEEDNTQLKERLQEQELQAQSREIQIKNAGSMAEAALALNGVFESVDKAVTQYMENIRRCNQQQEAIYSRIVSDAEKKAKAILENAEYEKQQKIKAADAYWLNLSNKLEAFYQDHAGLRELLSVQLGKKTNEKE